MAGLKLSRRKGFAFGSVVINNQNNQNGFYLLDVKGDASPDRSYFEYDVPKRNGSTYYSNKYKNKDITVVVGIYADSIAERRQKQREFLSKIIGIKSRLIFLDEPTLYYEAEIFEGVEPSEDDIYTRLTIKFKCSYCLYELLGDASDYITANANFVTSEFNVITNKLEWENISALTNKSIVNNGNFEALPLVVITANTACSSVTINNGINSFTLENLIAGEQIFVDSEKMVVYKIIGGVKQSVMMRFTGQFSTVPIGMNTIIISGQNFNINISVEFRNTYIV